MNLGLYTRLYLWLVAHRRWVLGVTVLLTAVSVAVSLRMDLDEDILTTLPQNDKLVDEYRYALRKFRQIDRVYIDVGIASGETESLGAAADMVFGVLSTNTAYGRILYHVETGGAQKVINYLTGALPNLFTEEDGPTLASKLEPATVRAHLTDMRRKLAGPEGMVLKDVVAADPVGMTSLVVAKVMPLQTGFGDAQIVESRITSGDGRHILMMAEPKLPSSNSGASQVLVQDLIRLARSVESQFPGVHVAITGGHRMAVDNATIIKSDATRCISIGMAGMLALYLVSYRRRWLAGITFLPSLFSTLVAGAVLAVTQRHLSAISLGFATIALGVTVDYAIYIIYHLEDASARDRRTVGTNLSQLVFPIIVGALTTIAAFLVMMTSPMRGYQQLGLFGVVGVVLSVAFALIILPLLVPMVKTKAQPPLWLTQWLENFFKWQSRRRFWLLALIGIISLITGFGVRRVRFEGDIAKLNGITESTRTDDALITKTWGSAFGMTLIVARGATTEEALAQNDRVAEVLSHATNVSAFYSLSSICPSKTTQEENFRRWQRFWTPTRKERLRETLQQVGEELGFREGAFETFWERLRGQQSLITIAMFHGTPLEQALSERVAVGEGDNAVSTLVKLKRREIAGDLRQILPETIVLDQKGFADHIAKMAKKGLGHFALWTSIAVAGILYLTLASAELVFATLLPLAFGLLWTFGAMGWLGVPIDLMNSIFVIFIIGVGEDYSVFFVASKLDGWRGKPPLAAVTTASVLISALTTIFGFGVLIIAKHPVLFSMGVTVLLGMTFTFIATLILTPMCMDLLLFKKSPRRAPRWWHLISSLWVLLHLGACQVFLYYVLRPMLFIISPRSAVHRLRRATRWLARGVVNGLPFGTLKFQNISSATFSDPAIVISNHQSAVDVMLVVSLPGDIRQTAKKRVFDAPMLGLGCKILGHVMVEPDDPQTTLRRCRDVLASGASVHFYPEGTRSRDGFVRRFHRGAFELAIELRQDILPVVLCDTNTAMPRDAYWFEPFTTTVRALPRVTPQNFDYSQGVAALMKHCETIVRCGLQGQLDAINTPQVVRRKTCRLYRYQSKYVEQFVYWKMKLDPVFKVLDQVAPRHAHVVDLGCGYGITTHWLSAFTETRTFWGLDYDEDKIRVAQCTAEENPRVHFTHGDIFTADYPPCDTVLLIDVLHYWTPEKQQLILCKAREALRPGGRLVLRDGARASNKAHRRVHRWEEFATRTGMNRTKEGLHFQTRAELESMLGRAGFAGWEIKNDAGNNSNTMLVASV